MDNSHERPNAEMSHLYASLDAYLKTGDFAPVLRSALKTPSRSSSGHATFALDRLEGIIETLHSLAARKDAEIDRIYNANKEAIQAAMRDFGPAVQEASELRRGGQDAIALLQRLNKETLASKASFESADTARQRVVAAKLTVASALSLLQRCDEANRALGHGDVYEGQRLLAALRTETERIFQGLDGNSTGKNTDARQETVSVAGLQPLRQVIKEAMHRYERAWEWQVQSTLNAWLTEARDKAEEVGRRARCSVEVHRATQAQRAEERMHLVRALNDGRVAEAMAALRSNLGRFRKQRETGTNSSSLELDSYVNMAPLLRLVHLHGLMGTVPSLLEAYVTARRAQLGAELSLSTGTFTDAQDGFLHRIVGYFAIESEVATVAPQLGSAVHATMAWEGAAAALAAEASAALEEATTSREMLLVTRSVLDACDALDHCAADSAVELPTTGIKAAIRGRTPNFRTILSEEAAERLTELSLQHSSSPPQSWSDASTTTVQATVADMQRFLSGLVFEKRELTAALLQESDQALASALSMLAIDAEDDDGSEANGSCGSEGASDALLFKLEITVNVAEAFSSASDGISDELEYIPGGSKVVAAVQRAEAELAGCVTDRCRNVLGSIAGVDWAPDSLPSADRDAKLSKIFAGLQSTLQEVFEKLKASNFPAEAYVHRFAGAVERSLAAAVLRVLSSHSVPAINPLGAQQLLQQLTRVAQSSRDALVAVDGGAKLGSGRGGGGGDTPLETKTGWSGTLGVLEALAFNKVEAVTGAMTDNSRVDEIECRCVAAILEKVKDIRPGSMGKTAVSASFTRREAVKVAKRIRGMGSG